MKQVINTVISKLLLLPEDPPIFVARKETLIFRVGANAQNKKDKHA